MRTTSPDGTTWRVGRVWWRGLPRWRRPDDAPDGLDLLDLDLGSILLAIVATVVLFLLFLTVLPAVVFAVEVLLLLLLALVSLLGRVLLRRPWTVRAVGDDGRALERRAVGWRASGRARDELAGAIGNGRVDR